MNTLAPGESVRMAVLPDCALVIKNNGWTLEITCEGGDIVISPKNPRLIAIGTRSPEAVDKFL